MNTIPADTRRDDNVIIASNGVVTSFNCVPAGMFSRLLLVTQENLTSEYVLSES